MGCGVDTYGRSVVDAGRTEKAARELLQIAFIEARRVGLCTDEADDCAMDLVLRALQQHAPSSSDSSVCVSVTVSSLLLRYGLPPEKQAAWLRRCARNFARNYRSSRLTREHYEVASCDPGYNGSYKTNAASAEAEAMMRLFRKDAYAAAHALPPHAVVAFARFHFQEEGIVEIALSSAQSPNALKQQLYRSRHQVRAVLIEQGHEHSSLCTSSASR